MGTEHLEAEIKIILLVASFCGLETVLSTLQIFSHLFLNNTLSDRYYDSSHFQMRKQRHREVKWLASKGEVALR